MQRLGWSKVDSNRRHAAADETAVKTINLRVTTTTNPKRQSLTQSKDPNAKLNATPKMRKINQKSQPTRDNTRIRRIEKIGSALKTILLVTESTRKVTAKRDMPKTKLPTRGKAQKPKG